MNALATTGMNEYWMNDFSQFQNSHSSVGTMKNGMKSGPSSAHTPLAIMPKAKECLKEHFHGKCAYCESEFESVAWGDVEHYRPKRKVTGEVHPGYYWLAYEPSNLMPSCQRCNQGDAKVNKFPIAAGGKRALTEADNLGAEAPLLLNPYDSSHCGWTANHLKYVFERDGWELLATGRVEGLTPEGKESVDIYKLNRPPLVKRRRKNQIAAIKALRATYDTTTFEQEWEDLFAIDQEHAVAVRAACEAWLQLQEERLLVAARRARGPSAQ